MQSWITISTIVCVYHCNAPPYRPGTLSSITWRMMIGRNRNGWKRWRLSHAPTQRCGVFVNSSPVDQVALLPCLVSAFDDKEKSSKISRSINRGRCWISLAVLCMYLQCFLSLYTNSELFKNWKSIWISWREWPVENIVLYIPLQEACCVGKVWRKEKSPEDSGRLFKGRC